MPSTDDSVIKVARTDSFYFTEFHLCLLLFCNCRNVNLLLVVLITSNTYNSNRTEIAGDGRCEQEIRPRIAQSKQAFNKLKSILTNKHLSFQIRERHLQCFVYSILTCG